MNSDKKRTGTGKPFSPIVLCVEGALIAAFVISCLPVFRSSAAAAAVMPLLLLFGVGALGYSHSRALRTLGIFAVAVLSLALLWLAFPAAGTIAIGKAVVDDLAAAPVRAVIAIVCAVLSATVAFLQGRQIKMR